MDERVQPAMNAAYAGDVAAFERALAEDPSLIPQRTVDRSPSLFQWVTVEGGLGKIPRPLRFVKILIAEGAPLDQPLVAAASVNAEEIVEMLLAAGAPIESCAPWTPLEECLYWGHRALSVRLRDKHGAEVRSLRAAAALGDAERVRGFFDEGGSLRPKAGPVRSPFGHASDRPQDVVDQAFLLALRNEQYATASILLDRGADIDAIPPGNHEQCTALHQAVYMNRPDMVSWLLDRGAVATIEDPRHGDTAVGWAKHFGHEAIEAMLQRPV